MRFVLPYFLRVILLAGLLASPLRLRAAELIYRVKPGDTLTGISQQHKITVSALAARNNLRSTDWISVGQKLIIPGSNTEPNRVVVEYVVKSGDSLATIAQRYGVTVSSLVQHNRINQPNEIKPGQRLKIPGAKTASTPGISSSLQKTLGQISVSKRWKNIVVHHSGTTLDTVSGMDRYHRKERHMENGLAYHFVIGNGVRTKDGEIYIGSRWRKQLDGGHLSSSSLNHTSIGICLIGNFNKRGPSAKQLAALRSLSNYLMNRCDLSKATVKMHREINTHPTECPGSKFPTKSFLATLP